VRCRLVASWGWSKPLTALFSGNAEVIIEPKTEKATRILVLQCRRVVHPVGKTISEVRKAYLAGFIDGDGAIMALLERHPSKRFGFRVRVWVKATQLRQSDVSWLRDELCIGRVQAGHGCWEWLVKDQSDVQWLLEAMQPFARVKARQVDVALAILNHRINSRDDLANVAELADTLSLLNVRSRGRRQNTAAMIQEIASRND
jgi:hypothetical protein